MNKLQPGAVAKICTGGGGFKLRENVSAFRKCSARREARLAVFVRFAEAAARGYGLPDAELFQTVDLFEKRNIAQVTQCIHALGRHVSGTRGNSASSYPLPFVLGTEERLQWTNAGSENVRRQRSRVHRRTTTCRPKHGRSTQRWHEQRC